ncbi:MAG: arsenate reductase ArsC [Deltaproteobacteria bacterium]
MAGKKKILFVCVGNSCRSQMAEGFAKAYGRDTVEVKSAGTCASGIVHRGAIEAMAEKGIDISAQTSIQLTDDMIEWAEIVVTTGCCSADELYLNVGQGFSPAVKDADLKVCPTGHKAEKYDWPIGDPLGRPWEVMQSVRDDIEERVKNLLEDIKSGRT